MRKIIVLLAVAAMMAGCGPVLRISDHTADGGSSSFDLKIYGGDPKQIKAGGQAYLDYQKGQNMTQENAPVMAPADRTIVRVDVHGRMPEPRQESRPAALSPQQQRAKNLSKQMFGR